MKDILVPIFVCVVLPVSVVLITSLSKMYGDKKRSQIIIKAIEANNDVDTDKLIEALRKPRKTARELLNSRLQRGSMFALIGLALIIVGIVNLCAGSELAADPVSIPLVFGGASLAIGLSYLITYFVTRKQAEETDSK